MKSPMYKVDLLIRAEEKQRLTGQLQEIGLLHLEDLGLERSLNNDPEWKEWLEAEAWLEKQELEEHQFEAQILEAPLLPKLKNLQEEWAHWKHAKEEYDQALKFWETWKGYDQEIWSQLNGCGLEIRLYRGDERDYKLYQNQTHLINKEDKEYYFCGIGKAEDLEKINLERVAIPQIQGSALLNLEIELSRKKHKLLSLIQSFKMAKAELEAEAMQIAEQWEFSEGQSLWKNLADSPLQHLQAWIPKSESEAFRNSAKSLAIAFRFQEPDKSDNVPVELANDRFSKLFEPITTIFQLPHYYEFDLTPLIAVFYPILFAYCLGDAGYGALMVLAVLIGWFSFLKKQRALAALVGILGISTTIMGLIKSGSLFGIPLSINSDTAWIASLGELVLIPDDSSFFFNAFNVALLIGVFQILIGILLAIAKEWYYNGFKESLSLWGKLLIVISVVAMFMSDTLKLSDLEMNILSFTLILGILLIMLFHDLSQSVLVRMGSSILPLFFIFTGLLGDVLSYVRLFALGVTSAVLGLVVNRIGMDMVSENWWTWIGAGAFLLFGHSLNFVLAALGSFIHPLRLTFVEFYNNAQFEGGGKAFKAFKRSKPLN